MAAQSVWRAGSKASAAGRGRDGAVVQVGGVHHRDREVKNEGRGRRGGGRGDGRRRLGSEQRAGRGGGLRGAGGGEELRLELQQLPHEAEVGRDDAAAAAHKLKGLVQAHALPLHQVGQADGGGARDPRLAVHQHTPTGVPHGVCGERRSEVKPEAPTLLQLG